MKFSIIIPQLFYDLIARVLPGFFFLLILVMGIPDVMSQILLFRPNETDNVIDSFGKSVAIIALSYALGWVFLSFTFLSKRDPMLKEIEKNSGSKSLDAEYQWIRLSHPPAGFRIVKLRAEARMLETSRTAMIAVILIIIFYSVYLKVESSSGRTQDMIVGIRLIVMLIVSSVLCFGFFLREKNAWKNYWGNIHSIYDLLHSTGDPIREIGIYK